MLYSLKGVVCGILWSTRCGRLYEQLVGIHTFENEREEKKTCEMEWDNEERRRRNNLYWRHTNLCPRLAKCLPRCIHFPLLMPIPFEKETFPLELGPPCVWRGAILGIQITNHLPFSEIQIIFILPYNRNTLRSFAPFSYLFITVTPNEIDLLSWSNIQMINIYKLTFLLDII